MVLSEGTLHEVQNYLFCDDKISGFRNWLKVWMSGDTDKVKISRFSSDSEDEQKQVLQETVTLLCVRN